MYVMYTTIQSELKYNYNTKFISLNFNFLNDLNMSENLKKSYNLKFYKN